MAGEELVLTDLGNFILMIVMSICFLTILGFVFSVRKSKQYRKYLADMYVAAKIRFLAKKDDLDIVSESEDFKLWSKKQRLENRDYDLDNTIEEELKESISTPVKSKK